MWSQYAFFRHTGATVFYALARVVGFEITSPMRQNSPSIPVYPSAWLVAAVNEIGRFCLTGITALGWFAWHGGGYTQGLSECKCSVQCYSRTVKMLQTHVFGVVILGLSILMPNSCLLGVLQQSFPWSYQNCQILGHLLSYPLLILCFPSVLVWGSYLVLSVSWSLCEVPQHRTVKRCCQQGCLASVWKLLPKGSRAMLMWEHASIPIRCGGCLRRVLPDGGNRSLLPWM